MSEPTSRIRSFNSRLLGRCRLLLAGLGLLSAAAAAHAQNTYTESFDYADGSALVTQGGWTQISSTVNPLTVVGGKVSMKDNGQDAGVLTGFTSNSGTLYAGFDLNVSAAGTGDYFFAFNNSVSSGTGYTGRFYAKTSGSGYVLGLLMGSSGTPTYSSTVLDFGTTYRVVIRYNFVSGAKNDTGTFYISPLDANEANDTAAITTATWVASNDEDTALTAVALRQGTAGSAPTIASFDNLVVSDSFTAAAKLVAAPAPSVASTTPVNTATNVAVNSPITVTFSEPVNVTGSWFTVTSTANGAVAATATGGPTTYTLTPSANFANSDTITVSVLAAGVTDQATGTTHPVGDKTFSFTTVAAPVAPSITTSPAAQTKIEGATVTFHVVAAGTSPFTYQWRKDGHNLTDTGIVSGSATDTLTLTGVALADSGSYDVVVTNVVTSTTSDAAVLTVNPTPASPTITTQPVAQTATSGGTVSFTVTATGTAPLTYVWRKNGVALTDGGKVSGATTGTLTLTGVDATDTGGYDVIISNGTNPAATSDSAALTLATATGLGFGGGVYKQNFDSLPSTSTFTLTGNGPLTFTDAPISAAGLAGWSFAKYAGSGPVVLFRVDTGTGTSGSIYSYGSAAATDRALGSLSSGTTVPRFGLTLVNTTGQTITQFTLSYTGEQWRRGTAAANKLTFEAAVGATDINTGTFVAATSLNFVAPVTTGSGVALDGNATANKTPVVGTVDGISWAPGQTLVLRWTDVDDTGGDDGLAIDDLSFDTFVRPAISSVTPVNGAAGVDKATPVTVTFNAPVNVTGTWYSVVGSVTGVHAVTVTGGPTSYTLTPTVPFAEEAVTVTVAAASVTDQATGSYHLSTDFTSTFSTVPVALVPIHTVQGSGTASTYAGQTIAVQGVVVASFQGQGKIGGYYIETPDADQDSDPATSEGIYIFDNTNSVTVGDFVSVIGIVTEYGTAPNTATEISPVLGFTKVRSGDPLPTAVQVSLPFPSAGYAERYEGMLVTFPQTLTVTDNYDLGQFGELLLSNGRLPTPTNIVAPGAPAQAQEALNLLNQVILDDGSSVTYPDPTPFLDSSDPAVATRRTGSTTAGVTGVLDNKFGAYVVEPTAAPVFVDANPRVDPPVSGGTLRVSIGNVENLMNGDGNGGGFPTSRGATTYAEYQKQYPKVAAAILKIAPDIMGLTEVENDGYGNTSTLSQLVAAINAAAPAGTTYAFVDASSVDIVTDQIHCAFIYRTETVEQAGTVAMLSDPAFNSLARNPLAQTFRQKSTGEKLTVCINHFRAKGSAASGTGNTDSGDGQGTNNALRVAEADALTTWLSTHPTGDTDPDVLIIGDLNSYAKEDPITHIKNAGYTSLTERFEGEGGYSYAFNGEFGHLDHALATSHLNAQVVSAATWHVNSDEPVYYDYNVENKSVAQQAINAGTPYRYADHDPVIIGVALAADPVAPTVATPPASQTVTAGATVTFQVIASGTAPFTYAWRKGGTPLQDGGVVSGAATATLTLTGVTTANAGLYDVIVTNTAGNIKSAPATLTVKQNQEITFTAPADVTTAVTTVPLSATASSGLSVSFTLVSGPATLSGSTLTLTGEAGTVTVRASQAGNDSYNAAGDVTRSFAVTLASAAPKITSQPAGVTVNAGATVTFTVGATGVPAPTYQWRKNGTAITGSTATTLTLQNVQAADAASYDVVVTNSSGSVQSQPARLILVAGDQAPVITSQPVDQTALLGHGVTFAVVANGVPDVTYQWSKNGTAIQGATAASLTIPAVQSTDAGSYSVVVTNRAGSATSRAATLRVIAKSYAGTYFGQIGQIGFFAIYIHDDNTGIFLGFLTSSKTPFVTKSVTVDDAGKFHFDAGSAAPSASVTDSRPTAGATATFTFDGTIDASGQLSGTLSGGATGTLTATKSADTGTGGVSGFYQAASAGSSAVSYTLVSPDGQVLLLTVTDTGADAGVGTVNVSGQITVTTAANATVSATVTGGSGTLTATVTPVGGQPISFAGVGETAAAAQRFVNASVRGVAGTGENVLIAGFVVTGTDSKPMLVRAVGPGLTTLGVSGVLAKPRLQIYSGSQVIASNTGWGTASNASEIAAVAASIGATPLAANSADSALYLTLPPGAYTMIASGSDGGTGVVLLETYDLSVASAAQKLVNVSGRAAIGTGDNVGIAGFVISGSVPKRVLIRGVGPSLAGKGVGSPLAHPLILVYKGRTVIAQNAGVHTVTEATAIAAAATQVGAFALTAAGDATLLLSLDPGAYTVLLADSASGTGVGVIEVYEVP